MRAKSSDDRGNVFQRLFERGEEALGGLAHDLLHGRGLPDGVAKLLDEAIRTRGLVDKNVEVLLHLLNLPSRSDYDKLASKVERLQGGLMNLGMKLDRILAAQSPSSSASRKQRAKKAAPER